ncbi:hypothetical protein [Glycomyces paridis]|uniref:Uncharacterized protein n=1 Tax=Glycomyces paridis TaxID=2126555 RepID=A0A4S8PHK6_9ACTN|nr:hypothetical protein [Glycomyces paridis]THV30083.1 hypothetical protein E9998_06815 [Glycomyces paridis]
MDPTAVLKLLLALPFTLACFWFGGRFVAEAGGYVVAGEWREGTVVRSFPCEPAFACEGPYASQATVEYTDRDGEVRTILVYGRYEVGDTKRVLTSALHDDDVAQVVPDVVLLLLGGCLIVLVGLTASVSALLELPGAKRDGVTPRD